MTAIPIPVTWTLTEGNLMRPWSALTEEDMNPVKGEHEAWFTRIGQRTGQSRAAMDQAIKQLFSSTAR